MEYSTLFLYQVLERQRISSSCSSFSVGLRLAQCGSEAESCLSQVHCLLTLATFVGFLILALSQPLVWTPTTGPQSQAPVSLKSPLWVSGLCIQGQYPPAQKPQPPHWASMSQNSSRASFTSVGSSASAPGIGPGTVSHLPLPTSPPRPALCFHFLTLLLNRISLEN